MPAARIPAGWRQIDMRAYISAEFTMLANPERIILAIVSAASMLCALAISG